MATRTVSGERRHTFLSASAAGESAEGLLDICLAQLREIPATANLGFLYATDDLADDLQRLLLSLKTQAPQVAWIGSLGMGLIANGQEFYDQPAMAVMIGDFPPGSFHILPSFDGEGDRAADAIHWWRAQPTGFALLHGDPGHPDIIGLLEYVGRLNGGGFINGGLTSSDTRNYQIAEQIGSGGLSGILFDQQVRVLTDHTQGCSPIGPIHELSQSERNIAVRLDNRPALEVMKEDAGEVIARDLSQAAGYLFAALPIPGSDTGDYLVRNLLGVDEHQGLIAVGDYLDDQRQLMFCRRDGNSASEDMLRMLKRLRTRLGDEPIRGGVYISCLGRGRNQFGPHSEELQLIHQELGEFPLVGFFANGEIYNGRLYGYTGVLTLFT